MNLFELILILVIVVLVFLPTKYDPAIKLKEWTERNIPGRGN